MKKALSTIGALCCAAIFSGCWTIARTSAPDVALTRAAANASALKIDGFLSYEVEYMPTYGVSMVYVDHWGGPRRRYGGWGHYETVPVTTYIPREYASDVYARQVCKQLEDCGFVVNGPQAAFIVSADFAGPYAPEGSDWRAAAVDLCSLFFAWYEATGWELDLRIREAATGRVVFSHRYSQEFSCSAFSPFWIFGIAAHRETDVSWQSAWCKTMLVRRAAADVSAFFATEAGGQKKTDGGATGK